MQTQEIIRSQYHASLEMLRQAVVNCPDSLWNRASDKNKSWHLAYHALFYTHLYLQPTAEAFTPWEKHREQYNDMGAVPESSHDQPAMRKPYTRDEILAYLQLCQEQVDEIVDRLNLDDRQSGFSWLPMGKLELQFYSIRHLMQHTGELCERLGVAGIDVDWVGMKPD